MLFFRSGSFLETLALSSARIPIVTRNSFVWNAARDTHDFTGNYNSYLLEALVAKRMKIQDKKELYKELDRRTEILEKMVKNEVFDYYKVFEIVRKYTKDGPESLDF